MTYSIADLLSIQGTDHICKVQMKRKPEIDYEYSIYRRSFDISIFEKKIEGPWKLCLNNFPYDVCEELVHLVLWIKNGDISIAKNIINIYFDDDIIWFANSPELMSIKSIFHVHIFILKKNINI
jgi:hypothetical protein